MVEEGKVIPFKEPEPQKGAKMARRAQKKSSSDRVLVEKGFNPHSRMPIWNPPFGARWGSTSPRLFYQGILEGEGGLRGLRLRATITATLRYGRLEDIEET